MNIRFIVCSISAACVVSSAFAQPSTVDQLDQQQQQRARIQAATGGDAPVLYDGESSDVGPQSVLLMKPRRTWIQAQADVQYFYTDNMFNTENNKVDTTVLVSMAEVAFAPTPFDINCGTLAPRVGYRYQWFNYGLDGEKLFPSPFAPKLGDFDFEAQTIFSDLTWSDGCWDAQVGFDFQNIFDSDYDETYRESVPHWGVQRSFHFGERSTLALGYQGDYRFTDQRNFPNDFDNLNNRTDHALYATFTYWLCPKAIIQPFYRFKYTYFPDIGFGGPAVTRNDTLHSFGASFYWIVCQNFNVRVFAGYDIRRSDQSFQDYERFDGGGGINLNFRF